MLVIDSGDRFGDFQEINYSIKIKSPPLNNNDNHYEEVRGGCRRQPPLTSSSIHEKLCNLEFIPDA
ncbi:hypothetical protein [Nostoc sp.]|uniref:hypothetical protein n=1 Tax=Nostoc sp. TaxID=1180 RepID=UPI002FF5B5ED